MSRLVRQVRVVPLLVAGIVIAGGWLVFSIAFWSTLDDGLALSGLVVCVYGMAIVGVLSIESGAERDAHRSRGVATEWSFFTAPLVVVWLSLVCARSWVIESSYGGLLSDQSGWSLTVSFAADPLTVVWGGFLGQHRAWGWVAGSAVAAATLGSVTSMAAYDDTGGDSPYFVVAFVLDLVPIGIALLVGVSCIAVARSVTSVGGGH